MALWSDLGIHTRRTYVCVYYLMVIDGQLMLSSDAFDLVIGKNRMELLTRFLHPPWFWLDAVSSLCVVWERIVCFNRMCHLLVLKRHGMWHCVIWMKWWNGIVIPENDLLQAWWMDGWMGEDCYCCSLSWVLLGYRVLGYRSCEYIPMQRMLY